MLHNTETLNIGAIECNPHKILITEDRFVILIGWHEFFCSDDPNASWETMLRRYIASFPHSMVFIFPMILGLPFTLLFAKFYQKAIFVLSTPILMYSAKALPNVIKLLFACGGCFVLYLVGT